MNRAEVPQGDVLQQLLDGLEEIIDEFACAGFSEGGHDIALSEQAAEAVDKATGETPHDEETEDGEAAEDDVEYERRRSRFPREDIEIGIDRFNSFLIRAGAVRKQETGRQPSLWRVFATLYGGEHPILQTIDRFESRIKGYFGFIEYEQMRAAFDDILEIRESVRNDLKGADVQQSGFTPKLY